MAAVGSKRKLNSTLQRKSTKKAKWKSVSLPSDILFSEGGLLGFEELDPSNFQDGIDNSILFADTPKAKSKKRLEKEQLKNLEQEQQPEKQSEQSEQSEQPAQLEQSNQATKVVQNKKQVTKGRKKTKGKNSVEKEVVEHKVSLEEVNSGVDESSEVISDMKAWSKWNLNAKLLKGLRDLGFQTPTPIQEATFTHAISRQRDVVGAAQTGSGKTLAYGLPILHHIMEGSEYQQNLQAIILTPTRELAKQVVAHLREVAKYTPVRITPIFGGVAIEKQERLLQYKPDIVVGTPGRLWELISKGNEYLCDLSRVRAVVLDEADRMVEVGHFHDLEYFFGRMRTIDLADDEKPLEEDGDVPNKKIPGAKRQTFVFSATLVDVRLSKSKKLYKGADNRPTTPLDRLMQKIDFKRPVEIVNLSTSGMTAEQLYEAKIFCNIEEKDYYLYYLLTRYPGKTIVFVNAVEATKRLAGLLRHLKINATAVHGSLAQKKRFSSVERVSGDKFPVLVATDVAARGLDVPDVEHVIHYSVPRTVELYRYSSHKTWKGRTARASKDGVKEGTSILLVGPDEYKPYYLITEALGKEYGIVDFPVDTSVFPGIIKRIDLAREISTKLYRAQKRNAENRLFQRDRLRIGDDAALSDEEKASDKEDEGTLRRHRKKMQSDSANDAKVVLLNTLLKQPLIPAFAKAGYSAEFLYQAKSGTTAVETLTSEIEKQKTKQERKEQQEKNKEQKQTRKKVKRQEKRKATMAELKQKFKNLPKMAENK